MEKKYDKHAESQKRNNINLSVLMLPFVYLIYVTFASAGFGLSMGE